MSATERKQLTKIVKSGAIPARTILRANILSAIDQKWEKPKTVQEATIAFNTPSTTVQNARTSLGEKGLNATLNLSKLTWIYLKEIYILHFLKNVKNKFNRALAGYLLYYT